MNSAVRFVKGHCGWDAVTLLPEGQVSASEELPSALKILSAPIYGGLEVGWMGFGERPNEITVRIVDSTTKTWLPMCGGMTQVIGKALVETFLRDHFEIDLAQPLVNVTLQTESGEVPIRISVSDRQAGSIVTVMDSYVRYLYQRGIEWLLLRDVPLLRVGGFAVIDMAVLERAYPQCDFTRRDPGPHLDVVNNILRDFQRGLGVNGVYGMLYDSRPEGPGQYRVFPRFYSDDLSAARLPWEFQCGTGSIAVALVLAHEGRLALKRRPVQLSLEWGSYRTTPDPYGIRTSHLELELQDRTVTSATFSHSVVEILAEGTLTLPGY